MQSPSAYLRWARERESVFWSEQLGYWVVTRYEDVKAVFRDNILFSPSIALEKITPAPEQSAKILQSFGYAVNRTMVNEDEPDHMQRRRLLSDAFLPERLLPYEPIVRSLARQCMDKFIHKGRADLVREMFYEVPLNIALKFLGVPDDGAEQLRQFAVAHTLNTWGQPTPEEQLEIATKVGKFWQTAQSILDQMMRNPEGEGWMYDSIRQHRRYPQIVTESYLRSMMLAILAAAHETTSNATANAFLTLLSKRSAWEDICANPALIPNAVEECLRVAGSIIAWRRLATRDAVIGGVSIPRGSKILIVQASANMDELHFEDPEVFNIYRESAVEHLTFGYGSHQCMGKNIGRMQMRIFLEEFTQRLPHLQLVEGQKFHYLSNTSFRGPSELWVEWDVQCNPQQPQAQLTLKRSDFYIGPPSKMAISRTVKVRDKCKEGERLERFVLEDARGALLPECSAGAHVELIYAGFRRKYSICARSKDQMTLEVVIQNEENGRGGSKYFCENLQIGDTLEMAGPKNFFKLDLNAQSYVLIAAGIGITPLLAMADELKAIGKSYHIHYAGQSHKRMALTGQLKKHHAACLTLYDKSINQRLSLSRILVDINAKTRVYACGPDRLITELKTLSEKWPEGVLNYEYFTAEGKTLDSSKEREFVVQLKDSDVELSVPKHLSVLQVLQNAGYDVPSDCAEGLCGTCEVSVLEGAVDHRDKVLSRTERLANQRMMTCCSRAIGNKITLAL